MKNALSVNPQVVFAREEDGALLFHPETGEVKILNETGAVIYQLLDGTRSEEEIIAAVSEHFDTSEAIELREEVTNFLADLQKSGLLGHQT